MLSLELVNTSIHLENTLVNIKNLDTNSKNKIINASKISRGCIYNFIFLVQ